MYRTAIKCLMIHLSFLYEMYYVMQGVRLEVGGNGEKIQDILDNV